MYGGGSVDGIGADLGEADVADMSCLHHVGDRADGLLDRHLRIEPGGPVDVDVVDAQALQRIGEEGLHRRRPAVEADPATGRVAQGAELDAELVTVARHAPERFRYQHLVVSPAWKSTRLNSRH